MQEWLNWHAWKACGPLKGSAGSNPALSAENRSLYKFGFHFIQVGGNFLTIFTFEFHEW